MRDQELEEMLNNETIQVFPDLSDSDEEMVLDCQKTRGDLIVTTKKNQGSAVGHPSTTPTPLVLSISTSPTPHPSPSHPDVTIQEEDAFETEYSAGGGMQVRA